LSPACATAKSGGAATFHFYQVRIQRSKHFAGGFIYVVGAAEITGIMISDFLPLKGPSFFNLDFAVVDQLLKKCGMVDDVIGSAQLRVFVSQGVETMRAGGDNFFNTVAIQ